MSPTTDRQTAGAAAFTVENAFARARDADSMRHRAVLAAFEADLAKRRAGFSVLDLGCGDGSGILAILERCGAESWVGVDVLPDVAGRGFSAGKTLRRRVQANAFDFLRTDKSRYDIVWLGLFFHHIEDRDKSGFLAGVAARLSSGGAVYLHDPFPRPGEARPDHHRRMSAHCLAAWTTFSLEERSHLVDHWERHGRQVSVAALAELAEQSGLDRPETLYRDERELFGLVRLRKERV